ncbi:hypothetical protein HDV06_006163 [Boothiomyces sp. JEL0866]|nr:hypothetical protein HDV06_006163 [Boothiomyces sp. JEL0866]
MLEAAPTSKFVSKQIRHISKIKDDKDARKYNKGSGNSISQLHQSQHSLKIPSVNNSTNTLDDITSDYEYGLEEGEEFFVEESKAIVAIIEIEGYSALISSLSKNDTVSAQLIGRSLEVYYLKIMNVVTEHSGDVVKIMGDSIYCAWRLPQDTKQYSEIFYQVFTLVVLVCVMCRDIIKESEIWALEDIAEEYAGMKLCAKYGIGSGEYKDLLLGVRGFRRENCFSGLAYREAINNLSLAKSSEIIVSKLLADKTKYLLSNFDISFNDCQSSSDVYAAISNSTIDVSKMQTLGNQLSPLIMYADESEEFSNSLIESYISDGGYNLLKSLKKQKKHVMMFSGVWVQNVYVCVHIKTTMPMGDQSVENYRDLQRYFEVFLKGTRKFGMSFHKMMILQNMDIMMIASSTESMTDPILVASKMTVHCYEQLALKTNYVKLTMGITSGKSYEGFLQGVDRSDYRVVASSLHQIKALVMLEMPAIIVTSEIYDSCRQTPFGALFSRAEDFTIYKDLYKISYTSGPKLRRKSTLTGQNLEAASLKDYSKKIQSILSDIEAGNPRTLVLEGPQGMGKSLLLQLIRKISTKYKSVLCSATAIENETFHHPLFPFVTLIPQILQAVDDFNVRPSTLLKPTEEVEKVRKPSRGSVLDSHKGDREAEAMRKLTKIVGKKRNSIIDRIKVKFGIGANKGKVKPEPAAQKKGRFSATVSQPDVDIVAKIRKILENAGESPEACLPLFNTVVQPNIEDTPETSRIGPDGRTMLLSALLALVILTSAPCVDWRMKLITTVRDMPQTETIELQGLSTKDMDYQLRIQFRMWCQHISKDIVESLKVFTDGRPTYVDGLIPYLKWNNQITVKNNELVRYEQSGSDELLPNDIESLFDWQYTTLNSKEFQRFVRLASVVGKEFSLEEVAALIHDGREKETVNRLVNLIKVYDYHEIFQPKEFTYYKGPNYPFEKYYSFTNPEFRDMIYDKYLAASERQAVHLKLVRFYEKCLTADNEPTFIPIICYHYQFAGVYDRDSVLQNIRYMVMLGNFLCFTAESYKEVIELYTQMEKTIEEHNLEDILGPNVRSEIHIRLGHAFSHGLPHEINRIQSLRQLMIAINLLDYKWPHTESEWWGLFVMEIIVWRWSHMYKFFAGNKKKNKKSFSFKAKRFLGDLFGFDTYYINSRRERLEHLQPILENMSRNLYDSDARLRDQIGCDLLVLNNSFRLGLYHSSEPKLLISLAIKLWFAGNRYFAKQFANAIKSEDLDSQTYSVGSLFWTASGRWDLAEEWAEIGMSLSQKTGEFNDWLLCSKQLSFMHMYNGHFRDALALEEARRRESELNGNIDGVRSAEAAAICIKILCGSLEDASDAHARMKLIYREVNPALRAHYQAIFAHIELANDSLDGSLDSIERCTELMPRVHYSNNQMFIPLLLSCLALFTILEKTKKTKNDKLRESLSTNLISLESKKSAGITRTSTNTSKKPVIRQNSTMSRMSKHQGAPPRTDMIVRTQRNSKGEIVFHYQQSKTPGQRKNSTTATGFQLLGIKNELGPIQQRVKTLTQSVLAKIGPFGGHCISEPITLLYKCLLKSIEPSSIESQALGSEGPAALRSWVQNRLKQGKSDMKLMVAIVAVKTWVCGNESLEYTSDLNLGMSLLAEIGIEGSNII